MIKLKIGDTLSRKDRRLEVVAICGKVVGYKVIGLGYEIIMWNTMEDLKRQGWKIKKSKMTHIKEVLVGKELPCKRCKQLARVVLEEGTLYVRCFTCPPPFEMERLKEYNLKRKICTT